MWTVRFELLEIEPAATLPFAFSKLLSTEIASCALFWANELRRSGIVPFTTLQIDTFRRALAEVYAGYIDGFEQIRALGDDGIISTFPNDRGIMADPFLRYALDRIGVSDADEATSVFDEGVVTVIRPQQVSMSRRSGAPSVLWSCMAPRADDASRLPEPARVVRKREVRV